MPVRVAAQYLANTALKPKPLTVGLRSFEESLPLWITSIILKLIKVNRHDSEVVGIRRFRFSYYWDQGGHTSLLSVRCSTIPR